MKIKGILIDVVEKEVREVEIEQGLNAIYEILQCELIEVAYQQIFAPANHVMFCDEEGLLKTPLGAFRMLNLSPISGNAIIFASNEEGEIEDHHLFLAQISSMVEFCDVNDLEEPTIKFFSWED